MTNPADSFFGGGSKSAKFETVGETVGGAITHIGEPRQQTDFRDGTPLTWRDGSPRMQLPVTVQTQLRDAADPTDDGKRTFYIKGEMKKAIEAALRAAGAGMAVGGVLTITFSGQQPTEGGFPKKLYTAAYQPPSPTAGFFSPEHGAGASPTVAQPVQTYAQQTTVAAPSPVQQQSGMVQLTPEQYAAMQAGMQQVAQPAPAVPESQKASYADYAARMGFTPTEQGHPAPVTDTPPF